MLARLRSKLPSRNTALFWGGVLGLTGFYKYNSNESKRRLAYYCKEAEVVANEPIGALDTPRKVQVYVAIPMGELGTRKARLHWEKYVLPVFVAGALDYELTLVNDTETIDNVEKAVRGGVHNRVAEEIKERRRKELEREDDNMELRLWREAIEERKKDNAARELTNVLGRAPGETTSLSLWKAEPYPGIMDVVAIGRETWAEVVNGLSEGAVGSLNYAVPPLVPLDSEHREQAERTISPQSEGESAPLVIDTAGTLAAPEIATAAMPQIVDYDRFDAKRGQSPSVELPAIAYIAHYNLSGWGSVPQKMWNFFHDQQNVDLYARQALQVVLGSTRRPARDVQELVGMGNGEEALPAWEGQGLDVVVNPHVAASVIVYDTQKDEAAAAVTSGSDSVQAQG
ncbi:mitochondrial import inner membrane translocase subunit tim54 [Coemansia thaxteri]|uniref:Mitochondrial import inner membrane translocase subunit TIM54 n=1 Tax=Coemansia thaxteri TaxID=2663907 RepID=A0A9W8BFI1_9FUNG|nr:mitochondrial import inner membrane translocase subunit tim54 [Coemansia thaxteri]